MNIETWKAAPRSITEQKIEAAKLMAIAREAGMAVEADDFGRGTFIFSSVDTLRRFALEIKDGLARSAPSADREVFEKWFASEYVYLDPAPVIERAAWAAWRASKASKT